jgi:hypothetical protein
VGLNKFRQPKGHLDLALRQQFTALAFIDQTLKQDPYKKIICLERGGLQTINFSLVPISD